MMQRARDGRGVWTGRSVVLALALLIALLVALATAVTADAQGLGAVKGGADHPAVSR